MAANLGDTPHSDIRIDPASGSYQGLDIGFRGPLYSGGDYYNPELHVVEFFSNYGRHGIQLEGLPVGSSPGSPAFGVYYADSGDEFDQQLVEVNGNPGTGQYRAIAPNTAEGYLNGYGFIEVNINDAGKTLEVNYKFIGSLLGIGQVSDLQERVDSLEVETGSLEDRVDELSGASWVNYSTTIGGTTTAPTKGTVEVDSSCYYKSGLMLHIIYNFKQTSAGTNGVGDYIFSLPSVPGYVVDASKIGGTTDNQLGSFGYGSVHTSTTDDSVAIPALYKSGGSIIGYRILVLPESGGIQNYVGSAKHSLGNASVRYTVSGDLPLVAV